MPRDLTAISTGFASLDQALGVGGIPTGRITSLEGAPEWALNAYTDNVRINGWTLEQVDWSRAESGDVAIEQIRAAVKRARGWHRVLVVRNAPLSGDLGEPDARRMTRLLRELCGTPNLTVVWGTLPLRRHEPAVGNAIRFYASIRVQYQRDLDGPDDREGWNVRVVKNKLAPPFTSAVVDRAVEETTHADSAQGEAP